jgi:ADP-ribose pyrophosphatase YjhB (NUDIX family)
MAPLAYLRRMLAISQAGLAYAKDRFDVERYQDLHDLTVKQLAELTDRSTETIQGFLQNESGYPTPKVDVRAFIRQQDQVLLVADATGHWALPGGFAEVGWTPKANVIKEVHEECGLAVTVSALRSIYDTALRPDIPQVFQYYKLIFACEINSGNFETNSETVGMAWFSLDQLPPLSLKRTTPEQLKQLFASPELYID